MKKLLFVFILWVTSMSVYAQESVTTSSSYPNGYLNKTYYGRFHSEDGVLFLTHHDRGYSAENEICETLVKFPQSKNVSSYTIPDGVYVVAKGAFQGNKYVSTIRIPSSVYYIGEDAFEGCENLKTIEIYESSSSRTRGIEADKSANEEIGRYNIKGVKVEESDEGVQIILYGDGSSKSVLQQ